MNAKQISKTSSRRSGPAKPGARDTRAAPGHPRSVAIEAPETERDPDQPFAEGIEDELDADLRYRMVSEAAYRLYAERGYTDGYDFDDWLQAEAAVDHLLLNPKARGRTSTPE